jgi:Rrf2 family iron-sulfur cluster assembly transcriptional regulator
MRLTTKGRYAVTAMLDLALHACQNPVVLSDISTRQGISLSYLEQLFSKLRQRKLVKSVRGPGGGYKLNFLAVEISVADVIDAVDESIDSTRCGVKAQDKQKNKGDTAVVKGCQEGEICLTHHLWMDLSEQIHGFLDDISLQDLMNKRDVQVTSFRQDQEIELIKSHL